MKVNYGGTQGVGSVAGGSRESHDLKRVEVEGCSLGFGKEA